MRYLIIIISICITIGLNISPDHETDDEPTLPNYDKKSIPDEPTYNPPSPTPDNPEDLDNGLHDYPIAAGDEILPEKFAYEKISPPDSDSRSIPNCALEGWSKFARDLDNGMPRCK